MDIAEKIAALIASESDGAWVIPPGGVKAIAKMIAEDRLRQEELF